MISNEKKILYIGVPVFAAVLMAIFYYLGSRVAPGVVSGGSPEGATSAESQNTPATRTYTNTDFKISLDYPASWKPVAEKGGFNHKPLYYKGEDGFFGIDALGVDTSGKVSIDDVVRELVSDASSPYGTSPSVTTPPTKDIETRLITPSANQPASKNGEAALVVRYPKPVVIGKNTFLFFMLYGDKEHFGDIVSSLKLIDI